MTKLEENSNEMPIPQEMGGKIVLSVLQKSNDHTDHVGVELVDRSTKGLLS